MGWWRIKIFFHWKVKEWNFLFDITILDISSFTSLQSFSILRTAFIYLYDCLILKRPYKWILLRNLREILFSAQKIINHLTIPFSIWKISNTSQYGTNCYISQIKLTWLWKLWGWVEPLREELPHQKLSKSWHYQEGEGVLPLPKKNCSGFDLLYRGQPKVII